jgi:hypothetical protein
VSEAPQLHPAVYFVLHPDFVGVRTELGSWLGSPLARRGWYWSAPLEC